MYSCELYHNVQYHGKSLVEVVVPYSFNIIYIVKEITFVFMWPDFHSIDHIVLSLQKGRHIIVCSILFVPKQLTKACGELESIIFGTSEF